MVDRPVVLKNTAASMVAAIPAQISPPLYEGGCFLFKGHEQQYHLRTCYKCRNQGNTPPESGQPDHPYPTPPPHPTPPRHFSLGSSASGNSEPRGWPSGYHTGHHRRRVFKNGNAFLTVLEEESPKSRHGQGRLTVRPCLLAGRQPCSPCVLREPSSYVHTERPLLSGHSPVKSGPTHRSALSFNYLLKGPVSLGVRISTCGFGERRHNSVLTPGLRHKAPVTQQDAARGAVAGRWCPKGDSPGDEPLLRRE